jgi:acyl-CoA reductase-like NAD-dependent aldehyde dehydrogenase
MAQKLQVVQAFDRAVITEIPADDSQALETKLASAARVMRERDAWLKPHQRSAILQRTAGLLEARQSQFARLIAQEGGKPLTDAAAEVLRAIDGLRNAAEELRNFAGREIPMGLTPASEGRWAFTTKEPIGVVAAISAFNHPLNLIVHQVAPAIAVGCAVIVKPAAATPLSCLELIALVREAGLAEPWCQTLLTGDNALAESLATDPRVAFLSFIGSARVGWHLRSKLAPGARCALEHGGAAPVIVDRSARVDRIIEPIVKGGYYHAGQVCVSTQRVFVHTDILGDFVERLAARVGSLRVGGIVDRRSGIRWRACDWRGPAVRDHAHSSPPARPARRCEGVSARSVRACDVRLWIPGTRPGDRNRKRPAFRLSGQCVFDGHRPQHARSAASRCVYRPDQ